jgi:hypothetical protein
MVTTENTESKKYQLTSNKCCDVQVLSPVMVDHFSVEELLTQRTVSAGSLRSVRADTGWVSKYVSRN